VVAREFCLAEQTPLNSMDGFGRILAKALNTMRENVT
jgi:hypothetical protein